MDIKYIENYLKQQLVFFDTNIYNKIIEEKQKYIIDKNEAKANYYWCLEHIYYVKKLYIDAYTLIMQSDYEKAWEMLERIEIMLQNIYDNIDDSSFEIYGLTFIRSNVYSFQKLFPYHLFLSRESVIEEEKCSICGKIISLRSRCNHRVGKVYMGKLCLREVTKLDLKAFAIVNNPMDKYTVFKPVGIEYNYAALEQLKKDITGPYEKIKVNTTMIKNPKYSKLGRNDICLCGSGKKYKYCCRGTDKELIPHNEIIFSHPIKSKSIKFTSNYKK